MSSPFVTAVFHPLNLMILVLAVAAGLVAAWWLFPLGLLVWLLMVVILSRDPSFRLVHTTQNRAPLAYRFQTHYDRVKRAQISLYNAINSLDSSLQSALQPVLNALNNLVDEVYNLCQRMTALENYRTVSIANANLQSDLDQLTEKINHATDPAVKQEYESAMKAMQERISKLNEAAARLDRVDAELGGLVSELNTQVTEILRLQTLSQDQIYQSIPEIVRKLEEHTRQIKEI
jgi:predicted nuclease with TOPRIM domain